tara:strand:+ start:1294 stop:1434 length:141 start_codon:yes stop_codon:yes gene_type:complete
VQAALEDGLKKVYNKASKAGETKSQSAVEDGSQIKGGGKATHGSSS